MKTTNKLTLTMPDLSPEAAYILADWIACLAHEVDLYYADEIRTLLQMRDREAAEMDWIESQIERQRELDLGLDDPISF